jgi:hypothetical protein
MWREINISEREDDDYKQGIQLLELSCDKFQRYVTILDFMVTKNGCKDREEIYHLLIISKSSNMYILGMIRNFP